MNTPPPETLALPSGPARVEWRRSTRARRVSLRVDPRCGSIVVTLPPRASHKAGMALLMSHVDWVSDRLAALPDSVPFDDGASIPICGVAHRIRHRPDAPEFLRRRVVDFLRAEARRRLTALVAVKAALAGVVPRRVVVKDTSSRWGSCAPDKTLAFSWRLVMAPDYVQDYVAAHEVAHIKHMNHGALFWAQVDRLTPHTKTAMAWLRRDGAKLQRMG